jgi:hypothetical protein
LKSAIDATNGTKTDVSFSGFTALTDFKLDEEAKIDKITALTNTIKNFELSNQTTLDKIGDATAISATGLEKLTLESNKVLSKINLTSAALTSLNLKKNSGKLDLTLSSAKDITSDEDTLKNVKVDALKADANFDFTKTKELADLKVTGDKNLTLKFGDVAYGMTDLNIKLTGDKKIDFGADRNLEKDNVSKTLKNVTLEGEVDYAKKDSDKGFALKKAEVLETLDLSKTKKDGLKIIVIEG